MTGDLRLRSVEVGDGVTLRCTELGPETGPPVLLLHGGASSSVTWERFGAELVAAGFRVVVPDLRGHGGSSRSRSYPLAAFHDDVVRLLDDLGIDRVSMVGHSLGAYTAWSVAQASPERVRQLVLEDPPVPPRAADGVRRISRARLAAMGAASLLQRRSFDARAVLSAIEQLGEADPGWWDRLPGVTTPTLVLSGGPGSHVPSERLAEAVEAMPSARLITVPVGHRIHSRSPERFAGAVVPFLTGSGGGQ